MRRYQLEPAAAILDSVFNGRGRTFVVMMSRQAGKNELSGQLEAYLLNLYQLRDGQLVKASPTFKPQTINSILRLCDRLDNQVDAGRWRRREGYMIELAGPGRCSFRPSRRRTWSARRRRCCWKGTRRRISARRK